MSQNEPVGVIQVERKDQAVARAVRVRVLLDGEVAGWLRPGEAITLTVAPGEHILHVGGVGFWGAVNGTDARTVSLAPGELAAFQVALRGKWFSRFHIDPVWASDLL
jgi:hypothetical protein